MPGAASYGSLPFREQIEFFRRKLNINTQAWTDLLGAEHDVAFMVAGANRDDLVADFREAVERAIADGVTLEDFRKDFDHIVEKHGWDYNGGRNWRSRVIYETNLRQSYNAGRWTQLQALKTRVPFWRYRHNDAVEHPRPLHEAWDGLVLSADDPWWLTHFPANGWGCQCYVEGLSERDMQRLGKSGPDTAPPLDMQTVTIGQNSPDGPRTIQTPAGVDPGFGYAPGRSVGSDPAAPPPLPDPAELETTIERTAQMALEKTMRLPAEAAATSASNMLDLPRVARAIDNGFVQWRAAVVSQAPRASTYGIGAIEPALVRNLVQAGIEPATAAIAAGETEILAASIEAAQLARLPALLRAPAAVLLDQGNRTLIYITAGDSAGRVAVTVQYQLAGQTTVGSGNAFQSAAVADLVEIRAQLQAGRLVLLQGSID